MSDTPAARDPAMPRYFALVAARIAGAGLMVGGIILIARDDLSDLRLGGYALVALGFVVMAYVPRALAKRWRTPPSS